MRTDNDMCPDSYAVTWMAIMNHRDGAEAMVVIQSMLVIAKAVPDVMIQPISQLVAVLGIAVVRKIDRNDEKVSVYVIPEEMKISMTPTTYES